MGFKVLCLFLIAFSIFSVESLSIPKRRRDVGPENSHLEISEPSVDAEKSKDFEEVSRVLRKMQDAKKSAEEEAVFGMKTNPEKSVGKKTMSKSSRSPSGRTVSRGSGKPTSRQIQQWQVALVVPPGSQQPGGLPPPAQENQGSQKTPPPGSIWIQIPGYYSNQQQNTASSIPAETTTQQNSEQTHPLMETTEHQDAANNPSEEPPSQGQDNSETTDTAEIDTQPEIVDNNHQETVEGNDGDAALMMPHIDPTPGPDTTNMVDTNDSEPQASEIMNMQMKHEMGQRDDVYTSTTPLPRLPTGCEKYRGQFVSENCRTFLNCWDGNMEEQECPATLLFSAHTGKCDFADMVDCGNRTNQDKPLPTNCRTPYATYRNPYNCSEFFVCIDGYPYQYNCSDYLYYNNVLGVCDYNYNVLDCPLYRENEIGPSTIRPSSSVDEDDDNSNYPPSFFMSKLTPEKTKLLQGPSGLIRTGVQCIPGTVEKIGTSCSRVAMCTTGGFAQLVTCPSNTAFDTKAGRCIIENQAEC